MESNENFSHYIQESFNTFLKEVKFNYEIKRIIVKMSNYSINNIIMVQADLCGGMVVSLSFIWRFWVRIPVRDGTFSHRYLIVLKK